MKYFAIIIIISSSFLPNVNASPVCIPYGLTDTLKKSSLNDLLVVYYGLKDALVDGDASAASARANEFLNTANNIDTKSLSSGDLKTFDSLALKLAFDARHISEVKVIEHQREHFVSLSSNMYKLIKGVKLSTEPVYKMYCPMKKAYWLSKDPVIRNPYYGKQMLSCGQVSETIR